MTKKKSILFIIIALVVGIAIGVGAAVLFNNLGNNNNTGTVAQDEYDYLLDEDGNIIEYDDVYQSGIQYRVCVFGRRGEEIENDRHWYGPYSTVSEALYEAKRGTLSMGFHEMHVYKENESSGRLTFFGKTYYYNSEE